MIKMHYKKISIVAVSLGLFLAVGALAEKPTDSTSNKDGQAKIVQDKKDANQEARTQNVCDRISQFADNLNKKTSEQENNVKTRHQERLMNWENKTKEADAKLKELRLNWDENRSQQFAKLEEVASTDEQKKAVSVFEATVKAAIATRQATMNSAIETFRVGIKNAIQTRQGQLDSLVAVSSSSRAASLAKAQADCAAGKDAATVRASFQNNLKGAKSQIIEDKKNIDKVNENVKSLVQVRQSTMQKAMGDFKAVMEQARLTLKKAFPVEATAVSTDDSISAEVTN